MTERKTDLQSFNDNLKFITDTYCKTIVRSHELNNELCGNEFYTHATFAHSVSKSSCVEDSSIKLPKPDPTRLKWCVSFAYGEY